MALKVTTKKTASAADMLKTFQKDHGDGIGSFGGKLIDATRIPTGLFPLDLSLGGGFPRGKCSMIYGPESSGKTNIVLLAIANHQRLWPDKVCVFVDVEQSLDPAWAKRLGVDTEKLIVIRPDYAEQMVDMVESLLYTEDCGIVAIDSLAALVTTSELEASAERANVGGSTLVIGKLVRKTTLALGSAEKAGRYPTLFYINQIRSKVGVIYGNPETLPGGNAPNFQAGMKLRVHGKNLMDPKVSSVMPVRKDTTFAIQKWKVPILGTTGKFEMVTIPHKGLETGQCDDFNSVSEHLKAFGMFEKGPKDKGWIIVGSHYDTIAPFKEKLYSDAQFGGEIRQALIERMLKEGQLLDASDE